LIEILIEKKLMVLFAEDSFNKLARRIEKNGEEPLSMMTLFE